MTVQQLTLSKRQYRDGIVVVAASGELDLATAAKLDDYLLHLASTGHDRLVLNAARLTFCDACGIRVLIRARARAAARRGWLRLAAAGPQLRRIIEILELTAALPRFENVFSAMVDTEEHGIRPLRSVDRPLDDATPEGGPPKGRPLTIPNEFLAQPSAETPPAP
jgi:anti-sigma B factor antagonist